MKMSKNTMIIVGVVALFLVYWFFFRKKKKAESGYMTWLGLPSENGYSGSEINAGVMETGFANLIGCGKAECEGYVTSGNGCCYRDKQKIKSTLQTLS